MGGGANVFDGRKASVSTQKSPSNTAIDLGAKGDLTTTVCVIEYIYPAAFRPTGSWQQLYMTKPCPRLRKTTRRPAVIVELPLLLPPKPASLEHRQEEARCLSPQVWLGRDSGMADSIATILTDLHRCYRQDQPEEEIVDGYLLQRYYIYPLLLVTFG